MGGGDGGGSSELEQRCYVETLNYVYIQTAGESKLNQNSSQLPQPPAPKCYVKTAGPVILFLFSQSP